MSGEIYVYNFPSIIQNNFTCSARLPSAKNPSMSSLVSEEAFGVLHPNAPVVSNSLTNVPRLQVKIYFIKLTLFMYSEFKRFWFCGCYYVFLLVKFKNKKAHYNTGICEKLGKIKLGNVAWKHDVVSYNHNFSFCLKTNC